MAGIKDSSLINWECCTATPTRTAGAKTAQEVARYIRKNDPKAAAVHWVGSTVSVRRVELLAEDTADGLKERWVPTEMLIAFDCEPEKWVDRTLTSQQQNRIDDRVKFALTMGVEPHAAREAAERMEFDGKTLKELNDAGRAAADSGDTYDGRYQWRVTLAKNGNIGTVTFVKKLDTKR